MKNIVWTRIDDRLVHGQVMTMWIQFTEAQEILIVDDTVAKDSFLQMVMKSSIPNKMDLKVMSVEDGAKYLTGPDEGKRIIVLVKIPQVVEQLIDKGVDIKSLDVGGIGAKAGRKPLYKNVSASEEEKQSFRNLLAKGVDVFFQVTTSDSKEDIQKYL
ncbi:MAG: PTS sugar transporter subunit IIB [Erysipelotrichaceae bacterium]|jgi:mannose/fructose/N-acetylgalactosamine-specific phosphotransferase system component IIB|nr:PTS sugar transporter subunit IIB [Erysipelotrichaceae bacterium]